MSEFEGFDYVHPLKYIPPVKSKDDERNEKIDATLEDIIYEKNHKNKKRTDDDRDSWHGDDYDDDDDGYRLKDDRRVHYITLHLPRSEIKKICEYQNIDTRGYFVKVEAVLTKRHSH